MLNLELDPEIDVALQLEAAKKDCLGDMTTASTAFQPGETEKIREQDAAKFRRMEELIAYAWYAAGRADEAKAIALKVGREDSRVREKP